MICENYAPYGCFIGKRHCKEEAKVQFRDESGTKENLCWRHLAYRLKSRVNEEDRRKVTFEIFYNV